MDLFNFLAKGITPGMKVNLRLRKADGTIKDIVCYFRDFSAIGGARSITDMYCILPNFVGVAKNGKASKTLILGIFWKDIVDVSPFRAEGEGVVFCDVSEKECLLMESVQSDFDKRCESTAKRIVMDIAALFPEMHVSLSPIDSVRCHYVGRDGDGVVHSMRYDTKTGQFVYLVRNQVTTIQTEEHCGVGFREPARLLSAIYRWSRECLPRLVSWEDIPTGDVIADKAPAVNALLNLPALKAGLWFNSLSDTELVSLFKNDVSGLDDVPGKRKADAVKEWWRGLGWSSQIDFLNCYSM